MRWLAKHLLLLVGAVVAVLGMDACLKPRPPLGVQAPPAAAGCLREPPPARRSIAMVVTAPCPAQFVGCLDAQGAIQLQLAIEDLHRWVADAYTMCGPSNPDAATTGQ